MYILILVIIIIIVVVVVVVVVVIVSRGRQGFILSLHLMYRHQLVLETYKRKYPKVSYNNDNNNNNNNNNNCNFKMCNIDY